MSTIAFGSTYSFLTSATPSQGWIIGYDTDGVLKQKDSSGNIILIGGGPTAGNLGTYSISQVLTVGNNTGTRSIIMGTATNIKSVNGGGKIELDRLSGTNSVLISSDNSSQLESYLILKNDSAKLAFNSSKQMIDLDGNGNQISIYNNNAGSISLGVDTGALIYGQLDEIKITYNATATASTGDYNKNAVLIGSRNSKIGNGVVNTVVLGGVGFTASNSNSVYVPDIYLQNQKGIKSTDSNEVFYLNDSNGYTLLDRNSGNLDSSWLLMATDYQSTYQSYIEIGVNSDPGYGNDSLVYIHNSKGPSYSYDDYSSVSLGKNILRIASKDVDGSSDELRIDMSAVGNFIFVDGPTASFKGIEYNQDYSLNFVTYSLVDKQYVDSQFTGFTLDVILTAGNNSESNDIVMGTATVIKSAQGGGQIDLDYVGLANEVFISTDNGSGAESYVSLSPTDAIVESVGSVTINGNEVKVSTNDLEGIKYLGNYESTFVTQSLVNKGYVDSGTSSIWSAIDSINLDYISEIITGVGLTGGGTYGVLNIDVNIGNGLEFVTNSIYLGGTLSQDTLIDGDLYNFEISNATNISLSASGFIDGYVTDLSGYFGETYLDSNIFDAKVGTVYGNTYSRLNIQNHTLTLQSYTEIGDESTFGLYLNGYSIGDGSTDNILVINDDISQKGLVYTNDYSSNFTTYSLVTKGYVDDKQQYVNNGLTFSSGYIGLGGTLSGPVFIEGYVNNVYFNDLYRFSVTASAFIVNTVYSPSTNTSQQWNDGDNYYTRVDDASGTYSIVDITPGLLSIYTQGGVGKAEINFYSQDQLLLDGSTNNRIIVTDAVSQKGIVYGDDYTANFTTYSLVTKGYVDSIASGIGGSGSINYVPKWNNTNTLSSTSSIYDDGSSVGIGITSSSSKLHIKGSGTSSSTYSLKVDNEVTLLSSNSLLSIRNDGLISIGGNSVFSSVQIQNSISSYVYSYGLGGQFGITNEAGFPNLFLNSSYSGGKFYITNGSSGNNAFAQINTTTGNWLIGSPNTTVYSDTITYKLEVSGTVSTTGFRMPTGASAGYVLTSDASGNGSWNKKLPYKVYVALLSQTGINDPTCVELENTFGITATFSYISTGHYELYLTGQLTSGKTFIVNGCPDQDPIGGNFGIFITEYLNTSRIKLSTVDDGGTFYDDGLNNTSIEIRVYP